MNSTARARLAIANAFYAIYDGYTIITRQQEIAMKGLSSKEYGRALALEREVVFTKRGTIVYMNAIFFIDGTRCSRESKTDCLTAKDTSSANRQP